MIEIRHLLSGIDDQEFIIINWMDLLTIEDFNQLLEIYEFFKNDLLNKSFLKQLKNHNGYLLQSLTTHDLFALKLYFPAYFKRYEENGRM